MNEQEKQLLFRSVLMLLQFTAKLLTRYVSDIEPSMRDDYHNLKADLRVRIGLTSETKPSER